MRINRRLMGINMKGFGATTETARKIAGNPGARKARMTQHITKKRAAIGGAAGIGVLAASRNSGPGSTKSSGRSTGVYHY